MNFEAREFNNPIKIKKWVNDTFKSLTEKENKCLQAYTNRGDNLNIALRKGNLLLSDYQNLDKELTKIINNNIINESIIVYRNITEYAYKCMKKDFKNKYSNVDDVNMLLEKAYMSTSLIEGIGVCAEVQLKIMVPKGTHAIYIHHKNELEVHEILLGKNTILKIIGHENNYIKVIVCEEI